MTGVSLRFGLLTLLLLLGNTGCIHDDGAGVGEDYGALRERMVREQIEERGLKERVVVSAMKRVQRELFVPESLRTHAYRDMPLPVGHGQTISQPFIVADMTARLQIKPGDKVLEIGTGSGYQAAVLAEMGAKVFSIEIIPELAAVARENLANAGYADVNLRTGDGYKGWPEEAPFDAILLTAAPPHVPETLIEQLAPGGSLIAPIGAAGKIQELVMIRRDADGNIREKKLYQVRFVPMTGEAQESNGTRLR